MPKTKTEKKGPIITDLDRCLACKSCEIECARAHARTEEIAEAVLSDEAIIPRVRVLAGEDQAVPMQCQHCEDAPCVEVCPVDALYEDEETGLVLVDPEECIGCTKCVDACPFDAIEWNEQADTVVKCDLCEGIVAEGEEPVCVTACPTRARRVASKEEAVEWQQKHDVKHTVVVCKQESEEE